MQRSPWFFQGLVLILAGILVLELALILILGNRAEAARAEQLSNAAVAELEHIVSMEGLAAEDEGGSPLVQLPQPDAGEEEQPPLPLKKQVIGGNVYVGYLEIPSLDKKLPVLELTYREQLQYAPGLQKGSPHTDDAVICGHNYPAHFADIREFTGGETMTFVDLNGVEIPYEVVLVRTISPEDAEAVLCSDYDLVLYTCTTGGQKRVMVACNRMENGEPRTDM